MKNLMLLISFLLIGQAILAQNLCNPNATPQAKSLMMFLREVYGKKILSGQCNERWLPLIQQKTGKQPAILALDFDGICPSQKGNNGADVAIDYVNNKGGIVQFQWHWISPNADGDYYSNAFKLADALNNPNGQSYKNMIRDIDLVAGQIKKMQDAGVPIIWRPLHESEGAWFWWGMSGKDATIKLYRLMYDRFTNYHKLNNIIWLWNSYGSDKGNWYPGDDVCDIIAWDYESGTAWQQYQTLFGNKGKLFGLAEVGGLPDPSIFSARPWSFFICWDYMIQDPSEPNQDPGGRKGQNSTSWTQKVYGDSKTINLSDLKQYNIYGRVKENKQPNLALNKPVEVTSTEAAYGNISTKINDGNSTTRWSSEYADPQSVTINLLNKFIINDIIINWETAYASTYKIEVSNDSINWTSVFDEKNGTGGYKNIPVLNKIAQYVKLTGTARATAWGYSIYEIQVYGDTLQDITTSIKSTTSSTMNIHYVSENNQLYISNLNPDEQIYLFNVQGQLMYSSKANTFLSINTNTWSRGIYFIKTSDNTRSVYKIFIE